MTILGHKFSYFRGYFRGLFGLCTRPHRIATQRSKFKVSPNFLATLGRERRQRLLSNGCSTKPVPQDRRRSLTTPDWAKVPNQTKFQPLACKHLAGLSSVWIVATHIRSLRSCLGSECHTTLRRTVLMDLFSYPGLLAPGMFRHSPAFACPSGRNHTNFT